LLKSGGITTGLPAGWKNLLPGVAIAGEIVYRTTLVNSNQWRQRWSSTGCVAHWLALFTGALPDGGFGSTLFLKISSTPIPAGKSFPFPKESRDACQFPKGAERPV